VGRGGRRGLVLPPLSASSEDGDWTDLEVDAFADAIERIMEVGLEDCERFGLTRRIEAPALDLIHGSHRKISRAHAGLFEKCAISGPVDRGTTTRAVPVRVVDLVGSIPHLHALLMSIAFLVQATTKQNPSAAMAEIVRDGLVGEGLTDAYFAAAGWEPVAGVGAFYRPDARTYGARLIHGQGLDHLFRRRSGQADEYAVVETAVSKGETPLDLYLQRKFSGDRLREAGAESFATPPLGTGWVLDRLRRSYVTGALTDEDYRAAVAAAKAGRLRRIAVVVACPDYDRPSRRHVPNPDQLTVMTTGGPQPLADEVVALRVPKGDLTTLVMDISNARARSVVAVVRGSQNGAGPWGQHHDG
jgi:hypothetical protein